MCAQDESCPGGPKEAPRVQNASGVRRSLNGRVSLGTGSLFINDTVRGVELMAILCSIELLVLVLPPRGLVF